MQSINTISVCSGVAGAVSRTATAPVDRVKLLLQVQDVGPALTIRDGFHRMASEGVLRKSGDQHMLSVHCALVCSGKGLRTSLRLWDGLHGLWKCSLLEKQALHNKYPLCPHLLLLFMCPAQHSSNHAA